MLHLTQRQTLQQKLSPAQVQYLKILQLPVLQLEQKIKDELEINPMLEEGLDQEDDLDMDTALKVKADEEPDGDDDIRLEPHRKEEDFIEKTIQDNREEEYSWDEFLDNNEGHATVNYYDSEDDFDSPMPATVSMRERLLDQVQLLSLDETDRLLVDSIVWNIDDDGYLRRDFDELRQEVNEQFNIEITPAEAEAVLKKIQRLDPPGIGSRDLRECLLTQLELMPNTSNARIVAMRILREAFDQFSKKHFDRIMQDLHISETLLKKAFDLIRTLNPKPGDGDGIDNINYIIPDFTVTKDEGEFVVQLNDRGVPPLRINRAYRQLMMHGRKTLSSETRVFLRQKMEAAKWFIQSIHQRRQTMYLVMTSIIERQREWFEKGKGSLRPLVYKDIADDIKMDISTISRVVNGKYVQTEWGVFELRYFFSEGIVTESGEEIANKEVMAILKVIIEKENKRKPLSDQALMEILHERGFVIARRTVAKYRESMDIPVSRLRKGLK